MTVARRPGGYRIDTSVDGVTWVTVGVAAPFGSANIGHLNSVTRAPPATAVRWVRLTLLSPQVAGRPSST